MNALTKAKKVGAAGIAEISEAELTCRIIEAAAGLKRPPGTTAAQALAAMDEEDRVRWRRAAVAAMEYWRECVQRMQQPA